jgi:hypothetical protein
LVVRRARSSSPNSAIAWLVTLPLERALGCFRLVADEAEIEDVQEVLRGSVIDSRLRKSAYGSPAKRSSMGHWLALPKWSEIVLAEKPGLAAAGRSSRRPSTVYTPDKTR